VSGQPQQPYLLRALYEWCVDSGYTPYVTVRVDARSRVPMAYVRDGQIVLNIGPNAVRNLQMDNEWLSFSARFGGVAHDILVPVLNVLAIYARETGEGMVFPPPTAAGEEADTANTGSEEAAITQDETAESGPDKPRGRPRLRVVK
jgi:stringent starvation protein B